MASFLRSVAERLADEEVGKAVRDQLVYILRSLSIYHVGSGEPVKGLSINGIQWELCLGRSLRSALLQTNKSRFSGGNPGGCN